MGSRRFRTSDRVRESRDYARSRAHGRRSSSRAFAIELSATGGGTRLGLVVSRRVGGAVVRNRVKRRVREWFRTSRTALPAGVDLVVIARSGAGDLSGAAVRSELAQLLARGTR